MRVMVNTSPMAIRAHSASNARPPERDWQESFYALESRYRQTQKLLNERDGEVKMLKVALRRGYPLQNTSWAPMQLKNKSNNTSKMRKINRQGQIMQLRDNNLPQFISEFDETLSSTLSSSTEEEIESESREQQSTVVEEQENRHSVRERHKNNKQYNKTRCNNENKSLQVHNNRDVLRFISPNTAHVAHSSNGNNAKPFANATRKKPIIKDNDANNIDDYDVNYKVNPKGEEKSAEPDVWASITEELASNLPNPQLIWGSETNVKAYIAASALHHANEELRLRLRERERATYEVEKKCAEYKREVQTLQTKLQERTLELHQVVSERDVAVHKLSASTQQIASYEETLQTHLRQTDTMRFEYDTQITELRSKLIAGSDSNEILTRDVRGLIQESREKTNELMALRSQLSLTESSLMSQRNMNENLLVEMKSLNSQLMEERKRLLVASREARQSAIAHDQLVSAQEQIRSLQEERTIMEQAHGKLLNEMVQLAEKATRVAEEQSQCKLDEAHSQAAHWEHVSQLLYKDVAQREAEYKTCREECEKWERQCTEYETQVQSLRSALSVCEAKLNVVWPRHVHDAQSLTLDQIKLLGQNKRRAHMNLMHAKHHQHHHHYVKNESETAKNSNNYQKNKNEEIDMNNKAENTDKQKAETEYTSNRKENVENVEKNKDDDDNDDNSYMNDIESILPQDFTSEAEQIEELLEANAWLESEVNTLQLNNTMLQDRIKELTRQRDNEQGAMHKAAMGVVQSERAKERLLMEQIDRVAFLEAQVRNLRGNRVEVVNSTNITSTQQEKLNVEKSENKGDVDDGDERNVLELFLGQIVSATGEPYTHNESINQNNKEYDYTFAHVFCSIDFLLHDTVTTPTITGLNGYFDTTVTFAVVMDELFWYYLQTREVVVQLHRIRDDDEVQRVLVHEEGKAAESTSTAEEKENVNMQSNVEGRISQDSSNSSNSSSKASSNDLQMAEHMYETIAQGKMSLMSFATSVIDSSKKLPMMRSHIKLVDAHHHHVASVEVQIRAHKAFSESFRYLIKTSLHGNHKNEFLEEFQNTSRENHCSNTKVSVETRAEELLKQWLSPSYASQLSDKIDVIINDNAQKKREQEEEQHTMQSPRQKEKNAWWEKIQEITQKALQEEQYKQEYQTSEEHIRTSPPIAPPTNIPSRLTSPASHVAVSPHVIEDEQFMINEEEEKEREREKMSETESTGTATSNDFTIHVPPPSTINAKQHMQALHKLTRAKDTLAPISSTVNNNYNTFNVVSLSATQKASHVELPTNVEIYALIVDVNRVELPHNETDHLSAHGTSSSYPPRLSCQYSLIPINVLANADNNHNGNSISRINQQLIKLAAPNSPRYTIGYAQSYYHYQHGCGEYFPITSRRELMQIIQTPLTLFLIDEDLSKQRQQQQEKEKNVRESVHSSSLAQKHDREKAKQANNVSKTITSKQETNMDVSNVWAIAVCEWVSAITEPNKPFHISLPLYHNNTIIPNAFVKVRLLALASSKSKKVVSSSSPIVLAQGQHQQNESVVQQATPMQSTNSNQTITVNAHTNSTTSLLLKSNTYKPTMLENKDKQQETKQREQEERRRPAPFVLEEELLRLELDRLRHSTLEN